MTQFCREKEVFFVRHCESTGNSTGTHAGVEARLTGLGVHQSQAVGARLSSVPVEVIFCSGSARAMETALVVSHLTGIPVREHAFFSGRRRPSAVGGRAHCDLIALKIMTEVYLGYAIPGHRHSDEENLDDLRIRTAAALDFLANYPATKICVVTHGSFLWALFCSVYAGRDFSYRPA